MPEENDQELRIQITTAAQLGAIQQSKAQLELLRKQVGQNTKEFAELSKQIESLDKALGGDSASLMKQREFLLKQKEALKEAGLETGSLSEKLDENAEALQRVGVNVRDYDKEIQRAHGHVKLFGLSHRQLHTATHALNQVIPGLGLALRALGGGAMAGMAAMMAFGTVVDKVKEHFKKLREEAEKFDEDSAKPITKMADIKSKALEESRQGTIQFIADMQEASVAHRTIMDDMKDGVDALKKSWSDALEVEKAYWAYEEARRAREVEAKNVSPSAAEIAKIGDDLRKQVEATRKQQKEETELLRKKKELQSQLPKAIEEENQKREQAEAVLSSPQMKKDIANYGDQSITEIDAELKKYKDDKVLNQKIQTLKNSRALNKYDALKKQYGSATDVSGMMTPEENEIISGMEKGVINSSDYEPAGSGALSKLEGDVGSELKRKQELERRRAKLSTPAGQEIAAGIVTTRKNISEATANAKKLQEQATGLETEIPKLEKALVKTKEAADSAVDYKEKQAKIATQMVISKAGPGLASYLKTETGLFEAHRKLGKTATGRAPALYGLHAAGNVMAGQEKGEIAPDQALILEHAIEDTSWLPTLPNETPEQHDLRARKLVWQQTENLKRGIPIDPGFWTMLTTQRNPNDLSGPRIPRAATLFGLPSGSILPSSPVPNAGPGPGTGAGPGSASVGAPFSMPTATPAAGVGAGSNTVVITTSGDALADLVAALDAAKVAAQRAASENKDMVARIGDARQWSGMA